MNYLLLSMNSYLVEAEFAVLEKNNIVCSGKIYCPEDNQTLRVQNTFHENITNEIQFESTELNAHDIYQELRIQGYDYGPKFKGLIRLRNDNLKTLYGRVQWNGNWITFLDSILQSQAIVIPFRKMLVPVMISVLRCDPKILFKCIEDNKVIKNEVKVNEIQQKDKLLDSQDLNIKIDGQRDVADEREVERLIVVDNAKYIQHMIDSSFHKYESIVPFYVDVSSRITVLPGLEIEDLVAVPIPRKTNAQHLKLESYQFIPNFENEAIDSCSFQMENYIEVKYG